MIDHIKSIKTLDKNLIVFLFSLTLTSIAAINISKYIEVYISDIGRGSEGIGNFVFVTGLVGIFTTFVIVPQLIKLKKDNVLMILINLFSAGLILIVFRMNDIVLGLYTVFMIYVILKNIYAPLEISFISSYATNNEYGKIMGIRQFFFSMGFVIGPLVAGFIYDIKPIYVFDLSVVMFLIGFVLILLVSRNLKRDIKRF
jgi:DHA1 family multidrug resistance protein-like MFS transporter